jgi:hypothetical protein
MAEAQLIIHTKSHNSQQQIGKFLIIFDTILFNIKKKQGELYIIYIFNHLKAPIF